MTEPECTCTASGHLINGERIHFESCAVSEYRCKSADQKRIEELERRADSAEREAARRFDCHWESRGEPRCRGCASCLHEEIAALERHLQARNDEHNAAVNEICKIPVVSEANDGERTFAQGVAAAFDVVLTRVEDLEGLLREARHMVPLGMHKGIERETGLLVVSRGAIDDCRENCLGCRIDNAIGLCDAEQTKG